MGDSWEKNLLKGGELPQLRAELEKKGQLISPLDMQIAVQVLSDGQILVTNNENESQRIVDLQIENWAACISNT